MLKYLVWQRKDLSPGEGNSKFLVVSANSDRQGSQSSSPLPEVDRGKQESQGCQVRAPGDSPLLWSGAQLKHTRPLPGLHGGRLGVLLT